ncbi:MAG: Ig-like domain-containing protein [Gemmatimonadales bacterium]
MEGTTTMLSAFPQFRLQRVAGAILLSAGLFGLSACTADGPGGPSSGAIDSAAKAHTPASVTVSPSSASGSVGQAAQFSAVVKDAAGRVLTGRTVTWGTSNSAVVSVTATGYATAIGGGSANLIATSGSVQGTAAITVSGVQIVVASVVVAPGSVGWSLGDSTKFGATVKDASGALLTGVPVTWTASDTAVLSVSSQGMGRAVGAGTAHVTATAGGKAGTASVTVSGGVVPPPASPVGSVVVTPGSASGSVGDAAQFTAVVLDTAGATLTGQTVTWRSTNTAVVSVSATGYATAVGGGSAAIVATAGGKSGQAAVTVAGAPAPSQGSIASISVSPASATVSVGGSQQLSAVLKDSAGNILTGRTVTWSSNAVQLATVSAVGLVAALVPGNLTVTAASGGKSGSASITVAVLAPPPQSGSWPNEPSGMTLYNDQPWSTWGAWQLNDNQSGNSILSTVSDAPFSPSGVFEDIFPVGTPGGGGGISPGRPDFYFPTSSMPTEVYVGLWAKLSNPYQPHSSGVQKLMYITDNNDISFSALWLEIYGTQAPMRVSMVDQFTVACPTVRFDPNVTQTPINPGEWHRYEVDFKMASSPSANDGVMRVWVDGVLNISATNVCSLGAGSSRLERVALSGMWGGAGDSKTEIDYLWYDHTRVSGR